MALQTLHGWWGNKPPPHRALILLGAAASAVLIAAGLICSANDVVRQYVPDLASLLLDLAKGTVLGTLTLSVLSDVQTWGASWRLLQGMSSQLAAAGNEFLTRVVDNLGLRNYFLEPLNELENVADRAQRIGSWIYVIADGLDDLNRARLFGLRDQSDPLLNWEALQAALASADAFPVDRRQLENLDDLERHAVEIEQSLERLAAALERARDGVSTGVAWRIDRELISLRRAPAALLSVRKSLVQLAAGGRQSEATPIEWSYLWTAVQGLAGLLVLIAHEARTGLPHPFRAKA